MDLYNMNDSSYARPIKKVLFNTMSKYEIRKSSVVHVTNTDTYHNGKPVKNGLFDLSMGPIEPGVKCVTCGQQYTDCPGHHGHIELAHPIFHVHFFDYTLRLLKCVCHHCGHLLVDKESPEVRSILEKNYNRQKRWELIYKLCTKRKHCPQCSFHVPKIIKEPSLKLTGEYYITNNETGILETVKENIPSNKVLRIFEEITDEHLEILGFLPEFGHPVSWICECLPVPPPAVRPSVRSDTSSRQEDDLTRKLMSILKNNNSLRNSIERKEKNQDRNIDAQLEETVKSGINTLQWDVVTMIDNSIPNIPDSKERSSDRTMRSVSERIKGKEGRIRGNLTGKRVDFSGRSVITADPYIQIDELGMPITMAMNLTFPEVVNQYNIVEMRELVMKGAYVYPGAKTVEKHKNGFTFMLQSESVCKHHASKLEYGDIVNRHLRDGDPVLFNRQPSLHRMSMMCHIIKVMPGNTFRLNVCVTEPYNADFDGDEMNVHVPQSYQTAQELLRLASVPTQIISPRDCKPIIGVVQDICTGLYKITKSNVHISPKKAMSLLSMSSNLHTLDWQNIGAGKDKHWTGRQLVSCFLPEKVNLIQKSEQYAKSKTDEDRENRNIVIKNGIIQSGALTKSAYQSQTQGIVQQLYNEYGQQTAKELFDNTQPIICKWLEATGFSVGIRDIIISNETQEKFKDIINKTRNEVYEKISQVHQGLFDNKSAASNYDFFEETVNSYLNEAVRQIGSEAMKEIDSNNRLIEMTLSQAKGSLTNVAQITGCVGQQNINGRRIPYGFDNRTLPHFTKFDDGPESRGFVYNSFRSGLTPEEFFFAAMGGREGLINTAVNSVTGDTDIIVIENGRGKNVPIGDWIDNYMKENEDNVQYFPQYRTEYFEFNDDVDIYIPTCDSDGKSSWGKMSAITRHDPVNGIYEVKTKSGRSVKVTGSKSLIVFRNGKLIPEYTANLQVGDFLPIIESLLDDPPVTNQYVDMEQYFPKTEYLYGTDFNRAVTLMREAMNAPIVSDNKKCREVERTRIRAGWWQMNNGTSFQLPFPNKARLQRATVRSNMENIIDGAIYPFHASRERGQFPDRLELNFDNGAFIGLFLADGYADPHGGHVGISKKDESILKWVENWAKLYNIPSHVSVQQKDIGVSTTIFLNSVLLERFLTKTVGTGARNKYFPDFAFTAPIEFVKGLVSGYISGDGSISNSGTIELSTTSKKLVDGLGLLCARIGVFGTRRTYQQKKNNRGTKDIALMHIYTISSQWVDKFEASIYLIHESKREKLKSFTDDNVTRKTRQNIMKNVCLDPITEITKLEDISKYEKVYDVTVPSTDNFCLGDLLVGKNTSSTGYTQRKLIKALEDLVVTFDYSVRDTGNKIVQYLYGNDGMDATKLEKQYLPTVNMTVAQIREKYGGGKKELEEYTEMVLRDRYYAIQKIFGGKNESTIIYPVAFQRLLNIYESVKTSNSEKLTIEHVLNTLEDLNETVKVTRTQKGNTIFMILARAYLNPLELINTHKMDKPAFDEMVKTIKQRFEDSLISPGEMVGIVAGESIGEPATQLVLNTFHSSGLSAASNAVKGIPRLEELLGVSKKMKTPIMKIKFADDVNDNPEKCEEIINTIRTLKLKDLVKSLRILYDPNEDVVPEDKEFVELQRFMIPTENELSPWLLRLELDRAKLLEYNLDMASIHLAIKSFHDDKFDILLSDANADNVVIRIKIKTFDADADLLTDLRAAQEVLMNFVVKGVKGIEHATIDVTHSNNMVFNPDTQEFEQKQIRWMYTQGSNLLDIMGMDGIDPTKVYSNNIIEVYEVLGIEAARKTLLDEIVDVLGNIKVNLRHISLLVDVMTSKGVILSVNRHGINKENAGVLSKCSFEETTTRLVKAGVFSESDNMSGVSANVMLGQIPPAGTGMSEIYMNDNPAPVQIREQQEIVDKQQETITHMTEQNMDDFDNFVQDDGDDDDEFDETNNVTIY